MCSANICHSMQQLLRRAQRQFIVCNHTVVNGLGQVNISKLPKTDVFSRDLKVDSVDEVKTEGRKAVTYSSCHRAKCFVANPRLTSWPNKAPCMAYSGLITAK